MTETARGGATRERLLQAVESLLAERAEHEITVRDITTAAGANVASVAYHFGSRDALVTEALRRVIARITEHRRAAIEALPPGTDLETLVRAWLAPALAALSGRGDEGDEWRMLARTFLSASPLLGNLAAEMRPEVERTLVRRLEELLPHLGPEELAWRHAATLGLAGFLGSGGGFPIALGPGAKPDERFVAFVVGALSAPAGDKR
ncbi:MAG: TetR/AcrR family transcriptional regulator [Solirubrobacteraceae bacterium]|nr:TetR/AcrR family transcriptional regulator [Solirubrobacteraceae bacterium]